MKKRVSPVRKPSIAAAIAFDHSPHQKKAASIPAPTYTIQASLPIQRETNSDITKKLDSFFDKFFNIQVEHNGQTTIVHPPYHMATAGNKKKYEKKRKDDNVQKMLKKLHKDKKLSNNTAWRGKAEPAHLKIILEAAVEKGLVSFDANSMRSFLDKYGISLDCSGYVSQAYNYLIDGNMTRESTDAIKAFSDSDAANMRGRTKKKYRFSKISSHTSVKPGDNMYKDGQGGINHIRIIHEVHQVGSATFFKTSEMTATKNPDRKQDGLTKRWWKYENKKTYYSWKNQNGNHPAATDQSWKLSNEKNTYGRYKKLEKKSE